MVKCQVILLCQEKFSTELAKGAMGQELFDSVKQKLELTEEADYFSISFRDSKNMRWWLNMDKKIDKQMDSNAQQPYTFYWEVKFYPPVPEYISSDLVRYLVVLQIRKDLFDGRLPASFHTLAILGSYTAQSELGDYDKNVHVGIEYLRKYSFAPYQSEELLMRIADIHNMHRGMTPAEADLYFLQNAKRMALFGMDMTAVKDNKNQPLLVGVAASGLYLYDNRLRMDSFKWPRIIKISYKAATFLIKVRPGEFEKHEKVLGLKLQSPKEAKRLWRIAVEHHQFFRLTTPETVESSTFGTFGSRKWRMSGRTQKQLINSGTPKNTMSRSGSYMSQDTYMDGQSYTGGTLPLHNDRLTAADNKYNTFGGHRNDSRQVTYDEHGRPIYNDQLNSSTLGRDPNQSMMGPGGHPSDQYRSEEDLLLERGYHPESGHMTDRAVTLDRRENGQQRPSDYESYDEIHKQNQAPVSAYPPGVGDLPLPIFSSESAGISYNGGIDPAAVLQTEERSEKRLKERETKLKNPRIAVDMHADIDDQLLLDAILAVTGLDPRLEVDKIVIKTEEDAP